VCGGSTTLIKFYFSSCRVSIYAVRARVRVPRADVRRPDDRTEMAHAFLFYTLVTFKSELTFCRNVRAVPTSVAERGCFFLKACVAGIV